MKKLLVIFALLVLCMPVYATADDDGDLCRLVQTINRKIQQLEAKETWTKVADHVYFDSNSMVVQGNTRIGKFRIYGTGLSMGDNIDTYKNKSDMLDDEYFEPIYAVYTIKVNSSDGIVYVPEYKIYDINNKPINTWHPFGFNNRRYNETYWGAKFYNILFKSEVKDDIYDNPSFSREEMKRGYETVNKIKTAVKNKDIYTIAKLINNYPFSATDANNNYISLNNEEEFINFYKNRLFTQKFIENVCNSKIDIDGLGFILGKENIRLYFVSYDANMNKIPTIVDIKPEN